MSAINVNSITGRTGTHGPVLTGITTATNGIHVTGGSVGIGTDNPERKIHVFNGTSGASSSNSNTGLILENSAASYLTFFTPNTVSPGLLFQDPEGAPGQLTYSHSDNAMLFSTNGDERLRITSGGNVGIGTDNPSAKLHLSSGAATQMMISNTSSSMSDGDTMGTLDFTAGPSHTVNARVAGAVEGTSEAGGDLVFETRADGGSLAERLRIDSSGRVLVGTTTAFDQSASLQVNGGATGFSANFYTFGADNGRIALGAARGTVASPTTLNSNDSIGTIEFRGHDGTSFKTGASIVANIDGITPSSDLPSRLVFATTADGASSPTERMRVTSSNFVNIGTQGTDIIWNQTAVKGVTLGAVGAIQAARDADQLMLLNRITNDGVLVSFAQDGVLEGTISVSGGTVSYNGGHLARWSQLPGGVERTEILRGSVLSNIDEMCNWGDEDNEQLNRMKVSDVEGDRNVAGVFQAWDDDDDTYTNDFYCAMTGDFVIRIAQGVTVERGDLLMSAGDGTAKPQDDDIIRSKTIAKVTSTHVSETYADGSYCVPCVLMAC